MFARRVSRSLIRKVWVSIWPKGGWFRALRYFIARASRMPGSAKRVASGFAIGGAVSFTPFVGAHFIISAVIARIFKRSILASMLGTALGNPITFPFIWASSYIFGSFLLYEVFGFTFGDEDGKSVEFSVVMLFGLLGDLWTGEADEHLMNTFAAMLLGGVIMGLIAFPLIYRAILPQLERLRNRKKKAIHSKAIVEVKSPEVPKAQLRKT